MTALFKDLHQGLHEAIDYEKGIGSAKVANREIASDAFYSEANMAYLRRGIKALNAGQAQEHELIEVD